MELIVLYDCSNSGKTTSLKIVYEVLKNLNYEETNVFRYLDLNYYRDFLDVLILDRNTTKNAIDLCVKMSQSTPMRYNASNIEDARNKNTITDNVSLCNDYVKVLSNIKRTDTLVSKVRVGVVLEGDYKDNLEKNLNDLQQQKCDVIICACNKRTKNQPFNDVKDFVCKNNASAYFVSASSNPDMQKAWLANAANVLRVLKNII